MLAPYVEHRVFACSSHRLTQLCLALFCEEQSHLSGSQGYRGTADTPRASSGTEGDAKADAQANGGSQVQ